MYSDSQDSHGLLTLHYGKHHATIVDEIRTCFDSESYADMTFICDDKTTLNAHRLVMASASPLVRRILVDSAHANSTAIIHIPGVKSVHMRHLLDFLYHGQACIKVSHLTTATAAAAAAMRPPAGNTLYMQVMRSTGHAVAADNVTYLPTVYILCYTYFVITHQYLEHA